MKKLLTLLLLCFALCINAQHMKFMGIPLNGSITLFQQKLAEKGIVYDKTSSDELSAGVRMFHGRFSGYDADIFVYYTPKTKNVYRAKVVIEKSSEDIMKSTAAKLVSLLMDKYGGNISYDDDGCASYEYYSMKKIPDLENMYLEIGHIYLYKAVQDSYRGKLYFIHIDYGDTANEELNESANADDL